MTTSPASPGFGSAHNGGGHRAGQRVVVTAGPYRGREAIIERRYAEPEGDGILYEIRLSGGEIVFLPAESLGREPV